LDLRLQGYMRFQRELYDPSLSPSPSQLQASHIQQKAEQTISFSSRLPFWPDRDDECINSLVPSENAQIGLGISWPLRPDCTRISNENGAFSVITYVSCPVVSAAAQRVLRMRGSEATLPQRYISLTLRWVFYLFFPFQQQFVKLCIRILDW